MNGPLTRRPWLTAALVGLVVSTQVHAQETRSAAIAEGTHIFRRILHDRGFVPLKSREDFSEPASNLIVVFGDLDAIESVPIHLEAFVRGGGAVLLASDRRAENEAVKESLRAVTGANVSGETFVCKLTLGNQYQNKDYCPILQPTANAEPDLFRSNQLIPGANLQVATNLPSMLEAGKRRRPKGISVLAQLPIGCVGSGKDVFSELLQGRARVFALGGEIGAGRILFLADHSIFINEMMLPTDNGNIEFTDNCLTWLRGPDKERTNVLFLDNGKVIDKFDVPLKTINLPPGTADAFIALLNNRLVQVGTRLAELGEADVFNQAIAKRFSPHQVYRFILVILSVGLFLILAYRVGMKSRYRLEPGLPRLDRVLHQHAPELALLDQRQEAMLASGNLWENARALARQSLFGLGLSLPEGLVGPIARPAITVDSSWWTRRRLSRIHERLWRLAVSPQPVRVSPSDCLALARQAEEFQHAVAIGVVRFMAPPS